MKNQQKRLMNIARKKTLRGQKVFEKVLDDSKQNEMEARSTDKGFTDFHQKDVSFYEILYHRRMPLSNQILKEVFYMFEQASLLETANLKLDNAVDVLNFALENLYNEIGIPKTESDENLRAICLYRRINLYTSQMECVLDRLETVRSEMKGICEELYNKHRERPERGIVNA